MGRTQFWAHVLVNVTQGPHTGAPVGDGQEALRRSVNTPLWPEGQPGERVSSAGTTHWVSQVLDTTVQALQVGAPVVWPVAQAETRLSVMVPY